MTKVEADLEIIKTEFEYREAEARFRRAQAKAKMSEAKAIMFGDMAEAQTQKLNAKLHRAEAEVKIAEIKELKATGKQNRNVDVGKPQPINQLPKGQARYVEKKHLSAKGLLATVHEVFQTIPDPKNSRKSQITLCDCLMSGLAVFSLKYPSLLQFNLDSQQGGCIEHNLKTLYKVNQTPYNL